MDTIDMNRMDPTMAKFVGGGVVALPSDNY